MDLVLKIGTNSLTDYAVVGSYEVNSEREYDEWTDANYTKHRVYKRDTVSGSFDLFIKDLDTYALFVGWIQNYTDSESGTVPMTVTVNNLEAEYTGDFFLTFEATRNTRAGLGDYIEQFTVEIEEA